MTKGMTAIDDLQSYEAIVDAHAQGIKKLAIAFKPLYASMPEAQQKNADLVFSHRTEPKLKKPVSYTHLDVYKRQVVVT